MKLKRKKFIIFILTFLITGVTWFLELLGILETTSTTWELKYGFPLSYYTIINVEAYPLGYSYSNFYIWKFSFDLLFWFLVLAGGWWIVKKFLRRGWLSQNLGNLTAVIRFCWRLHYFTQIAFGDFA